MEAAISSQFGKPGEIDREPPIGWLNLGGSFLVAARNLRSSVDNRDLRLPFDAPIYFLYSHALELTMKAFLRGNGFPAMRLASREFGHQLQVLWKECTRQGLSITPKKRAFINGVIEILDPVAMAYRFRYLKVGEASMPELDDMDRAVELLMCAVTPLLAPPTSRI